MLSKTNFTRVQSTKSFNVASGNEVYILVHKIGLLQALEISFSFQFLHFKLEK